MRAAPLSIRLLGGFSVEIDGAPVADRAWRLRKARALVKVCALASGRRVHRDVVCDLLWPDRGAAAAANNLHQALHAARRALGDPAALTLTDDTLALDPGAWVDVDAFEAAGDLDTALALYAGELLPEDRYEPWTEPRRTVLAERHVELCVRAATGAEPSAAVPLLHRAVAAAPLHEPAVRSLMLALAATGRRQDALAQFERLRDALRDELAADPDPETRALYRELLAGDRPAPPAPPPLPVPPTPFVGRGRELGELHRLMDRARLVTLTGPGGAGKTRLALELARVRARRLRDGAWLADLGTLRQPGLVPQAVATALGVPLPANRPALDGLIAHLAQRELLIVLDTCEHVLDACAHLAEALLAAGPGVRLLATSREALRCPAEVAWRVPALAEAATLFRDRAAAAGATDWSAEDDALIDDICWRLDGMPLAVELAAARTGALTLTQIAGRLGGALDMLTAGSRTALTRQQTLRATIDWSHDLLTDDERVVFRRLSAFTCPFTLEGAEAVGAGGPIAARRVADLAARLADKSLLVAEGERFRLMDTIRQFGEERLHDSGEGDAVAARHLVWFLQLIDESRSLDELETHHDDLRAALAFALRQDPGTALTVATKLWPFWLARSYFVEGNRWLDAVLAAAPERTALRVDGLLAAAGLALRRGDTGSYLARVAEAVGVYGDLGDPAATAEGQQQHAIFEEYYQPSEQSAALFEQAVATARRLGEDRIAASALHASAMTPWHRFDTAGARARLDEAIERLRALPDGPQRFLPALTFGQPVLPDGPAGAPRMVWEATLFLFRRLTRDEGTVLALNNLAWVLRVEGDLDGAARALADGLALARVADDRLGEAMTLAHLGHHARTRGAAAEGLEHLHAGVALLGRLGERRDAEVFALGIGLLHAADGDLAAARAVFERGLERFVATDDLPAIAGARANWAIVEERIGDLGAARDLYGRAAATWRAQHLNRIGAWSALGHGCALHALGAHDEAVAVWRAARIDAADARDARAVTELNALLAAAPAR